MSAHVSHNSGNNEWYTPPEILNAAKATLGTIDCDPASSDVANRSVGAVQYYTKEQDGLTRPWGSRVWMNPPYAQPLIQQFADALRSRVMSGEVEEAIVLVNNGTETRWFRTIAEVATAICFLHKRVRFIAPDGTRGKSPLQGQVAIYVGSRPRDFAAQFKPLGVTAEFLTSHAWYSQRPRALALHLDRSAVVD